MGDMRGGTANTFLLGERLIKDRRFEKKGSGLEAEKRAERRSQERMALPVASAGLTWHG